MSNFYETKTFWFTVRDNFPTIKMRQEEKVKQNSKEIHWSSLDLWFVSLHLTFLLSNLVLVYIILIEFFFSKNFGGHESFLWGH